MENNMSNKPNFYLEPSVKRLVLDEAASRGVSPSTFISVGVRSMIKTDRRLGLDDHMPVGKYKGELIENIVRCDFGYTRWMLAHMETYHFHPEVEEFYDEMREAYR